MRCMAGTVTFSTLTCQPRHQQTESYDVDFASKFLGGRGFAVKILWDRLRPGTDALSPENKLIFAAGPLTGYSLPNSGKLVVASKSPLTGGYGDGNIGTWAAVHMRTGRLRRHHR